MLDESSVTPTAESNLPDEVLQIPFLQAIFAGSPAATSFNIKAAEKSPEAKIVAKNRQGLQENGINFYRSLAGDTGVIFNSLKISDTDIQEADKMGKLLEIAPPVDKISADILQSGANHPALITGAPNSAPAAPTGAPPPQSAQMPMAATAPANRQKLAAQLKNLQLGAPTSGPAAGQGQLLRSIMKPVL